MFYLLLKLNQLQTERDVCLSPVMMSIPWRMIGLKNMLWSVLQKTKRVKLRTKKKLLIANNISKNKFGLKHLIEQKKWRNTGNISEQTDSFSFFFPSIFEKTSTQTKVVKWFIIYWNYQCLFNCDIVFKEIQLIWFPSLLCLLRNFTLLTLFSDWWH